MVLVENVLYKILFGGGSKVAARWSGPVLEIRVNERSWAVAIHAHWKEHLVDPTLNLKLAMEAHMCQ